MPGKLSHKPCADRDIADHGLACRIRHTIVLDDPFDVPPQLEALIPPESPEPQFGEVCYNCADFEGDCIALVQPAQAV